MKISRLEKSYGSHKILKGISIEIERGQFVALLGPSGSGKTTILRCIAGLEFPDPDGGTIEIDGKILSGPGVFIPPEKRRLGMVFQSYAVWPHMNVFENVAFPLRIRASRGEISVPRISEKVSEVLDLVQLSGKNTRFSHQLSGGEQQRVALARALVLSPRLLLLDEPLSNLDALLRDELGAEIRKLQRSMGLTTILVTHDQKEALSLSDRVILLNGGAIDADGAPEALYSSPPTEFAAEFLSGGQRLRLPSGETRMFLPRRWKASFQGDREPSKKFIIQTRIFLGSEYEYWAQSNQFSEPFRFYSNQRFEMGSQVFMTYTD